MPKSPVLVQLCISAMACGALLPALGSAQSSKPLTAPPQSGSVTAEQKFKNIQVLKGIPSEKLIPAMQFITASLGVECAFCHVENHFDQDDKKPKQTARKMMQMMMAINQNNFEGQREVTCNTCHRGARTPQAIPSISLEASATRPPVVADEALPANLPTADQLISKYVAALGGEKAIQRISSRVEKGTANFAGREVSVDVFDKAPAKRVSVMHLPNGDSVTAFDGQQGWLLSPGRPARETPPSEVEGTRIDADLQFPLHIKALYPDLKPARPEEINGHVNNQLVSEADKKPRLRLFFDEQTGLLTRLVRYGDSPLGLNPVQVDYADYRAVDSVQVPYRWTVARPSGQFTIQASEVAQNVPVDDAKFVKPAEPAASVTKP